MGKLDPIVRLEAKMIEREWAEQGEIDELHARVRDEIDEAVAWAEQSPFPDPATLLDGVYENK